MLLRSPQKCAHPGRAADSIARPGAASHSRQCLRRLSYRPARGRRRACPSEAAAGRWVIRSSDTSSRCTRARNAFVSVTASESLGSDGWTGHVPSAAPTARTSVTKRDSPATRSTAATRSTPSPTSASASRSPSATTTPTPHRCSAPASLGIGHCLRMAGDAKRIGAVRLRRVASHSRPGRSRAGTSRVCLYARRRHRGPIPRAEARSGVGRSVERCPARPTRRGHLVCSGGLPRSDRPARTREGRRRRVRRDSTLAIFPRFPYELLWGERVVRSVMRISPGPTARNSSARSARWMFTLRSNSCRSREPTMRSTPSGPGVYAAPQ